MKTDGSRLSLRALLHYLWEQAEFNRWRPAMTGRRNWAVLRKFLLEAAEGRPRRARRLRTSCSFPKCSMPSATPRSRSGARCS
nr:DUF1173 family protein [Xanthobacter dioxanivorans]